MNNWQLLVAAGFPTATGLVAIGLAILQNGRLDGRIDRLEAKLEKLEAKMDLRFNSIQRDQREFYAINDSMTLGSTL